MFNLPVLWRRSLIVAWDVLSWALAFFLFVLIRYDLTLSEAQWQMVIAYTLSAIALQIVGGFALHLYLGRSRVGSFDEASTLGILIVMVAVSLALVFFLVTPQFPRGVALMLPPLAMVFMAAGRGVFRTVYHNERRRGGRAQAVPALVYGAGDAGSQVARLVDTAKDAPYRLVGFLDDDPAKRFLRVRSYRVLGKGDELLDVAAQEGAEVVVLAVTEAEPSLIQSLSDRGTARIAGIDCWVPSVTAQRLLLILHAIRGGAGESHPDIRRTWGDASDADRAAVQRLAAELKAEVPLAAATGRLEDYRHHREYQLWRLLARGGYTLPALWLARVRAAPTPWAALRAGVRMVLPNPHRMEQWLGRRPTARDLAHAYRERLALAVVEVGKLVRRARHGGTP